MDDQFCVVPYWSISSLEADNLLSDFIVGCDDNSTSKTISRLSSNSSKLSTGYLSSEELDDVLQRTTFASVRNDEGLFLCNLDDENDRASYCDGGDISWLNEFMNAYGISTLDSKDDFSIKSTGMTIVTTSQAKENHAAVVLTSKEMNSNNEVWASKCVTQQLIVPDNVSMTPFNVCTAANANISSVREANIAQKTTGSLALDNDKTMHLKAIKIVHDNIHQRSSIVPPLNDSQKFAMSRTCFDGSNERKREQNRCAAIRYRGKRREEVKQMKQELHVLELRNIELKTEMNWLEKEVFYLRDLMKLTKSF